ncbi:MAG: glycoside hydrolase family 2 protein [Deltaproteobacteria bacterium]|nr:glycoside hydrolase family 2 protein [Deltaproteobacteria bacterium]
MRRIETLAEGWELARGDGGAGGEGPWHPVTLPHAWNTSPGGVPAPGDDRGPGWYRRALVVPEVAAGRRAFLEIGAAGTVADVYVGGTHLAHHRGGYSAFRCDLTGALDAAGRGLLAVRVDNAPAGDVYPLTGDHTIFGGLYRPVRLLVVGPVHVDLLDHGGPGVVVRPLALDGDTARVRVTVRVANDGATRAREEVAIGLRDGDGTPVASATAGVTIAPGALAEAAAELVIERPRRWDGRRDPHRYRVVAEVAGDRVELPFGLRTFAIDPRSGVTLNGRPYRLHGVSRHHDVNGTPAVSRAEIERDIDLVDELGATALRLAHYQHAGDVLDLCDERGIVVWAEIPVNAKVSPEDPLTNAAAQLTELIRQQRHHPSILCWGVQNEAVIGEQVADPRPVAAALAALARKEDPDRPTAQAQLTLVRPDDPINRIADLNALNLYHGWYHERAEGVGPALDAHRAANPDVPLGLSEYGADARPDFHAGEPVPGDYTEEYQALFHEVYWRAIEERPWLWATFVWNLFDFASAIRDEGGTRGFNMKGLVTRDRRIRKDAFWWYKAHWSREPVLHVCGRRFVNRHDPELELKVYANHPEVRLLAGGRDLGVRRSPDRVFRWRLRLGPGETTVVALAGGQRDEATFRLAGAPDPSYVCPAPRRVQDRGAMASWYESAGIAIDPGRYGTWSLLGELLDDPATRAILVEEFGPRLLDDPRLEVARGFPLDFVLGAANAGLSDEQLVALHARLTAVPKPVAGTRG